MWKKSWQILEATFQSLDKGTCWFENIFQILTTNVWKKSKFSNLVHTKVLKMSRLFYFSPFVPTSANFHLLYVALLEVENFLAYSKCLQQAAIKIQKLVRIRTPEPWEVEKKLKKKLWPEGGSIWGPLAWATSYCYRRMVIITDQNLVNLISFFSISGC